LRAVADHSGWSGLAQIEQAPGDGPALALPAQGPKDEGFPAVPPAGSFGCNP